jgi:molybdopterin-guanine dinucleotide biosynthesis protein A
VTTPRCLVLAHGRALRLHSETGGSSKGLLPLDARTTILDNLLDACAAVGLDPLLTVRPDDDRMAAFAAARRTVAAHPRQPGGYIVDLAALSTGAHDVIAIDCDTVAAPYALREALGALLASPVPVAMALAAAPLSDDPRSIRPVRRAGRITGLSADPSVPRTAGLYRFRGAALDDLRAFVARGGGTFHDYMERAAAVEMPLDAHVMDLAHNVNWPADHLAARAWWSHVGAGRDA